MKITYKALYVIINMAYNDMANYKLKSSVIIKAEKYSFFFKRDDYK